MGYTTFSGVTKAILYSTLRQPKIDPWGAPGNLGTSSWVCFVCFLRLCSAWRIAKKSRWRLYRLCVGVAAPEPEPAAVEEVVPDGDGDLAPFFPPSSISASPPTSFPSLLAFVSLSLSLSFAFLRASFASHSALIRAISSLLTASFAAAAAAAPGSTSSVANPLSERCASHA